MTRALNKLTDTECKARTRPGMLGDGGGLYLSVQPSGSKSWAFIWKSGGRRREMGLGPYPAVKLANARKLAVECREAVAAGRDPIAERGTETVPTFAECTDRFLAAMESQWRNQKHRLQWRMTLAEYAKPLSTMKVSAIGTDDVLVFSILFGRSFRKQPPGFAVASNGSLISPKREAGGRAKTLRFGAAI